VQQKNKKASYVGLLAGITVAAIVVSVALLLLGLRDRELRHARLEMNSIAEMLMVQTEQNIEAADLALQGIQERINTAYGSQFSLDSLPIHLLLASRLSGMRHLRAIFLTDEHGIVVNSSRDFPIPNASVVDREYFKALSGGSLGTLFIDKPVRSRLDNSWTLNFSRTLIDRSGKFRGVIVATVGVAQFESIYDLIKLDYPRPIGIYLTDGTLVASWPHRENTIATKAPELVKEKLPETGSEIRDIRYVNGDGISQDMAIGRLTGYPLLISVSEDADLALASWRETALPIAAGGILVCLFTMIAAAILISKVKSEEALAYALSVANDLYQHTVDAVMDAIVAIDATQHIVLFNPAAEKMFGLKAELAVGQAFEILIPERLRPTHAGHIAQFVDRDLGPWSMAPQMKVVGRHADGHEFPIESTISKSFIGSELQLTAVLRDVTERQRKEVELRELNTQLRNLSNTLQTVREQERARLSRELHDELGQQLTGLKLSLSWLANRIRDERKVTIDSVNEMRQQLDVSISSVRRISTELRPLMLDELGFDEAIAWQCSEFEKRSNLVVTLSASAAKDVKGQHLSTAIFRIVQESLTNVAKHADATKVKIDLMWRDDALVLAICDDGKGIQANANAGGIGLVSMRERAIAVGAQFNVVSTPGSGTTVELILPKSAFPAEGECA
jgi:PAS domain S-box-containing protein